MWGGESCCAAKNALGASMHVSHDDGHVAAEFGGPFGVSRARWGAEGDWSISRGHGCADVGSTEAATCVVAAQSSQCAIVLPDFCVPALRNGSVLDRGWNTPLYRYPSSIAPTPLPPHPGVFAPLPLGPVCTKRRNSSPAPVRRRSSLGTLSGFRHMPSLSFLYPRLGPFMPFYATF